jgi:hypothetical protein
MEETLYTDEDQAIVEIAKNMCHQIGVTRFNPKRVSWLAVRPRRSGNPITSDSCNFDRTRVIMPLSLRGRMPTEELKSVIAPALIFQSNSGIRLRYNLAILSFAPYIVGMGTLGTLLGIRVLSLQRGSLAALVFLVVFLVLFLLFFLLVANGSALYSRKLRLIADDQAAKLVGSQNLLHVLKEIDAMKLEDIEANKTREPNAWSLRRRPSWRPSIIERIENLTTNAT